MASQAQRILAVTVVMGCGGASDPSSWVASGAGWGPIRYEDGTIERVRDKLRGCDVTSDEVAMFVVRCKGTHVADVVHMDGHVSYVWLHQRGLANAAGVRIGDSVEVLRSKDTITYCGERVEDRTELRCGSSKVTGEYFLRVPTPIYNAPERTFAIAEVRSGVVEGMIVHFDPTASP